MTFVAVAIGDTSLNVIACGIGKPAGAEVGPKEIPDQVSLLDAEDMDRVVGD